MNKEELEELYYFLLEVKYALIDLVNHVDGYEDLEDNVKEYLEKIKNKLNNNK